MKKVIDVINKNLTVINSETGLDEIIKLMKEKKIGKLPVVAPDGEVLGVVTRDDILIREENAPVPTVIAFWEVLITLPGDAKFQERVKKMSSYKAKDLMSNEYLVSKSDDNLSDMITKMLEEGYEYSLVIENKKLVGIVTKSDLISNCF